MGNMTDRMKYGLALVLGLVCCAGTLAQSHSMRFSIDGGYAAEFPSAKSTTSLRHSDGAVTSFGVGYRLSYGAFRFDVGVGAEYTYLNNSLNDSLASEPFRKEWAGGVLNGVCDTTFTNRHDRVQRVALNIPVMFGGEWGRIYALAGAKFSAYVFSATQESGYKQLGWSFPELHYIDNRTTENTDYSYNPVFRSSVDMDIRLCAEFGCRLNSQYATAYSRNLSTDYYIAAFAEYGVYHTTPYAPFVVGVRLTAVLHMPRRQVCHCSVD